MNEKQVEITTSQGPMTTYTFWPDGKGPFPAIIFYMDAPAIREELFDMAKRMASEGYYVILPDLFYRFGLIRFPFRSEKTKMIWRACMANMSNADVMEDTRAMLDYMDGLDIVKKGKKATIGYCMSGRLITAAAGTFPDVFAANASLYGVAIVNSHDDSSHKLIKNIKGEMYYGFAETDSTVPDYVIPTLKAELKKYKIEHVLEVLPGTEHGFCFPSRPCYDHAAAEKVWKIFMDMCKRQIG